jgi:hypothetical protein
MILSANRDRPGFRPCAAALLGLLLAACNASPVDWAQYEAENQCILHFLKAEDPSLALKLAKLDAAHSKFRHEEAGPMPEAVNQIEDAEPLPGGDEPRPEDSKPVPDPDKPPPDDTAKPPVQADDPLFRFVSTGDFVVDWKKIVVKGHAQPFHVTCTGDFNARRIKSVTYNGTITRPAPGEVWSF